MTNAAYIVTLFLLIFALIVGLIYKQFFFNITPNGKTVSKRKETFEDYEYKYFSDANYSTLYGSGTGENLNWNDGVAPCYKSGEPDKIYRKQVKLNLTELGELEIEDQVPLQRPRCCNANDFETTYDDATMDSNRWNNGAFCGTKTRNRVKKAGSADCVGDDPNGLSSEQKTKTNGTCCEDVSYVPIYYDTESNAINRQNGKAKPDNLPGFTNVPCEMSFNYYEQKEKQCKDTSGERVTKVGERKQEEKRNDTQCPIDCVVSGWSDWSGCSSSQCGTTGTQKRTRRIVTHSAYGGKVCPSDLEETQRCSNDPCPVDCELRPFSDKCDCQEKTRTSKVTLSPDRGGKSCIDVAMEMNPGSIATDYEQYEVTSGGSSTRGTYLKYTDNVGCKNICKSFIHLSTKKANCYERPCKIALSHDSMYGGRLRAHNHYGTVFHIIDKYTTSCDLDIPNTTCIVMNAFVFKGGINLSKEQLESQKEKQEVWVDKQARNIFLSSKPFNKQFNKLTMYKLGGDQCMFIVKYDNKMYALKYYDDDRETKMNMQFEQINDVETAKNDDSFIFVTTPADEDLIDKTVPQSYKELVMIPATSNPSALTNPATLNRPSVDDINCNDESCSVLAPGKYLGSWGTHYRQKHHTSDWCFSGTRTTISDVYVSDNGDLTIKGMALNNRADIDVRFEKIDNYSIIRGQQELKMTVYRGINKPRFLMYKLPREYLPKNKNYVYDNNTWWVHDTHPNVNQYKFLYVLPSTLENLELMYNTSRNIGFISGKSQCEHEHMTTSFIRNSRVYWRDKFKGMPITHNRSLCNKLNNDPPGWYTHRYQCKN